MKRILLVSTMLLLMGCSPKNLTYIHQDIFSMEYPQTWSVVAKEEDLPPNVLVAFVSPITAPDVANITVTSATTTLTTTEDFAAAAEAEFRNYPSLVEGETESIRISGQKTLLKRGTVQKNESEFTILLQTYVLKDNIAYILTASLPGVTPPDSEEEVIKLLKTFELTEVEAAE